MTGRFPIQRFDSARMIVAIAFVGLTLCLMIYGEVTTIVAPLRDHSMSTFISFNHDVNWGDNDTPVGRMDLGRSWRPRILSRFVGSLFTKPADTPKGIDGGKLVHLVGVYVCVWLGLTFLLYLVVLRDKALVPILGTYAAVAFAYMPGIGDRVYSWDMPALFFFTVFTCLLVKGKLPIFLVILPIATLFKETTVALVPAFLFLPGAVRKRLLMFGAAAALFVSTKITADIVTHSFSPGRLALEPALLLANLHFLVSGDFPSKAEWFPTIHRFVHPVFLNAGLLMAFFLYPFRNRYSLMLRTVVVFFVATVLVYGIVFEYRIWIELTPVLLLPLYLESIPAAEFGDQDPKSLNR